jgi:hypothetical protein
MFYWKLSRATGTQPGEIVLVIVAPPVRSRSSRRLRASMFVSSSDAYARPRRGVRCGKRLHGLLVYDVAVLLPLVEVDSYLEGRCGSVDRGNRRLDATRWRMHVCHIVHTPLEQCSAERTVRRYPSHASVGLAGRDQLMRLGFIVDVPHGSPTANDYANRQLLRHAHPRSRGAASRDVAPPDAGRLPP